MGGMNTMEVSFCELTRHTSCIFLFAYHLPYIDLLLHSFVLMLCFSVKRQRNYVILMSEEKSFILKLGL